MANQGVEVLPHERPRLTHSAVSGRRGSQSVRYFSTDEVHANVDMFEEMDTGKTWSRQVVEGILRHWKVYFPGKDKKGPEAPRLTKAWAYFEHYALARFYVGEDGKPLPGKPRAEPGDSKPSELYHPFTTAESNLAEWGIGVALYFATLRVMGVILLLAGLISIPNILYFAGDEYSPENRENLSFSLQGSAICTTSEWVVCTSCGDTSQWATSEEQARYATATSPDGEQSVLVLRNDCNGAELQYGIVNYAAGIFLVLAISALAVYQRRRETLFDIGKQTASDYSVVVKNPPGDATDPDEWKNFFEKYAEKQVTVVTIALDNDALLRKLINRRVLRSKLKGHLPKGVDLDDEDEVREAVAQVLREREGEEGCFMKLLSCTILPILNIFNYFLPPDVAVDKIFKVTEEIKELQQKEYNCSEVFVTFETEAGQRNALGALSTSKMNLLRNNADGLAEGASFRGIVLEVEEPKEPNTIRWLDLHITYRAKMIQRAITFLITCGIVAGAGWLVALARSRFGPSFSAPLTTIFNSTIPIIVKLLLMIEKHSDEGSLQQSLYLKITLFRWVNTAILTQIITPFTSTIAETSTSVLPSINAILWSELWLSPFLRVLDIMGNLNKHFFGPRAKTQENMNLWFQGTVYNLGERYTDFTKVMFVCFYYSALFPASFFFCGTILLVQYYTDKFCLMRIWATAPFIGPQLAIFSRRYFFSVALVAFAIVSAFAWAQFPYDNLCQGSESGFAGTYTDLQVLDMSSIDEVTVTQDNNVLFCYQGWTGGGFRFPAVPGQLQTSELKWMTASQETLTRIYGWSSLAGFIIFVVVVFGGSLFLFMVGFYRSTYQPDGEDQHIDFSSEEISAFVPQFKVGAFQYPFIACDVDEFDKSLIDWQDPDDPQYDTHNLMFDMEYKGMKRVGGSSMNLLLPEKNEGGKRRPIFGICKSWNPYNKPGEGIAEGENEDEE